MKKKLSLFIVILFYGVFIFAISYYLICPNIKKVNEIRKIKPFSDAEKTILIEDVNKKYDQKMAEIDQKYKELKAEVAKKYQTDKDKLRKELASLQAEETKEFRKNGFSKKYYDLSSDISKLQSEINDLDFAKANEEFSLDTKQMDDNFALKNNKSNEIKNIEKDPTRDNAIKMTKYLIIIVILALLMLSPFVYVLNIFNKLIKLRNIVKARWSEINVYLKQRSDMIPNIVEVIKGSSGYEKDTLIEVTKARNQVVKATTKEEEISANEQLGNSIEKILFLAEDYPDLKSNSNFMSLQEDLNKIEEQIATARSLYNKAVLNYNNNVEVFPSNVIASMFNFKPELFFEIAKEESINPNINFN